LTKKVIQSERECYLTALFICKTKLSSSPVYHLVMKIIAQSPASDSLHYELPTATHTKLYLTLTKKQQQAASNKQQQRTHLLPDHAAGAPKRDLHNKWDGKDRRSYDDGGED
jgi:hypothetical protein